MIGTKSALANMIRKLRNKLFIMLRYVRLIFCGEQSIEKTVKSSTAYETDVPDFHWVIWFCWTRLPKGMSIRRVFDRKLFAKDIEIGHQWPQGSSKTQCAWVGVGQVGSCDR
jgi:hypothetical protein